jgi:uncharacterized delta-60 repeat protein
MPFRSRFALARYHPDGSLDRTFGQRGKVLTDFANPLFPNLPSSSKVRALAMYDDRIIAAGATALADETHARFALARYNRDGSLDTTFGRGGKVLTNFSNERLQSANALVMFGDKIIAGGWADIQDGGTQFALACYNSNGSLDITFGRGGKVLTDFASTPSGEAIARVRGLAVHEKKIIVCGDAQTMDIPYFALARYNADGSLDTTFGQIYGQDGKVLTAFENTEGARAYGLVVSGDRIIVGGHAYGYPPGPTSGLFALACYDTNGRLDTAFGQGGKVLTDFTTDFTDINGVWSRALAMYGDKLVIGGPAQYSDREAFALACYNADGSLDQTFGQSGKVLTDFGMSGVKWFARLLGLAVYGGKIIAGGCAAPASPAGVSHTLSSNTLYFTLACYNADGSLDQTFGQGGKVLTDLSPENRAEYAYAITTNENKIIAGGTVGD